MIVDAHADDMSVEQARVGHDRAAGKGAGGAGVEQWAHVRRVRHAQVIVKILGLDTPFRVEHPLDAGARRPAEPYVVISEPTAALIENWLEEWAELGRPALSRQVPATAETVSWLVPHA